MADNIATMRNELIARKQQMIDSQTPQGVQGKISGVGNPAPFVPAPVSEADDSQKPDVDKMRQDLILKKKADIFNQAADAAASSNDPQVTKMESFFRGAAQGATLKFQDELSPIAEKLIANVFGDQQTKDLYASKSMADLTKTYRDQNKAAEDANPKSYFGGEALGSVIPAAATMGPSVGPVFGEGAATGLANLAKAIGVGAAQGAVLGGTSEAGGTEGDKGAAFVEGAKSGAKVGAISTAVAKPAIELTGMAASKIIKSAQNVSDDVVNYFRNNPDKIEAVKAAAQDKGPALAELSTDIADGMSTALNGAVQRQTDAIDTAIAAAKKPLQGQKVIDAINSEINGLEKTAVTPPKQQAVAMLKQIRDSFFSKFGGTEEGVAIPAEAVNALRKDFNAMSKPAFQKTIGDNPIVAKSADTIADSLRSVLDDVDPQIRQANNSLKELMDLQKNVAKKFSAQSFVNETDGRIQIDPDDIQKILNNYGKDSKNIAKKFIDKISNLSGIDLPGHADFVQAVKTIDEKAANNLSRVKTGYSVLLPFLGLAEGAAGGAAVSSVLGMGPIPGAIAGGALGAAGGAVAQSPLGLKALINAPAIGNAAGVTGKTIRGLSSIVRKSDGSQ